MSYIEKMKEAKKGPTIPELVVELMEASTKLHVLHLRVTGAGSYAAHKTLNELYDALPGHADTIAESYQGATGKILEYPEVTVKPIKTVADAITYLQGLYSKIAAVQKECEFSEIVNDLDTIKSTINSGVYKLKFLS
jgi:DNA-binding ferritin-like protein